MTTKTILVTGGNSGIGLEMVKAFISGGHEVAIAARDLGKTLGVINALKQRYTSARLHAVVLDLADFNSIDAAAEQIKRLLPTLDTVMLNAGSFTRGIRLQENGLESMVGSMHFGHFRLMQHLLPVLKAQLSARVVVTASVAHWVGTINEASFRDLALNRTGIQAYGQAKLANLIYARSLADQLKDSSISVNAFHPGGVATGIWRELPKPIQAIVDKILITPAKGADTAIWLALAPEAGQYSGQYFVRRKPAMSSPISRNAAVAASLWAYSENAVGIQK